MSEQHDELEPAADQAAGDEQQPAEQSGEREQVDEPAAQSADDELEQQLGRELDELHDGPDEQAGDEPQPQPPAQPSDAEVEATYKKLDKETERHVKRVAELVGDAFAYLVPCELCEPSMPGFRWPREPADEVKEAVRRAIGDRQPENWQADQYSRQCEACAGLGEVLTGSRVRGQETLACMICDGKGWQPIGNERRGGVVRQLPVAPPAENGEQRLVVPTDDPPEVAALKAQGYVVIAPARVE